MAVLTGWPTDGADGSVSSEARWRKMARLWTPSGVITGLVPTLGSGVINVTAGSAWVDGHYCELTSPASETNSANGLLVVRFTPASNLFELVYRTGVSSPTQTDATWELPIALMTAGALTDRRVITSSGPRGPVGPTASVGAQNNIGGVVFVTGATLTMPAPGRVYRYHTTIRLIKNTSAGHVTLKHQHKTDFYTIWTGHLSAVGIYGTGVLTSILRPGTAETNLDAKTTCESDAATVNVLDGQAWLEDLGPV